MTKLFFLIMCVSVVQWSRSCLHTCKPGSTPATLFSVSLYVFFFSVRPFLTLLFLLAFFFLYSYCSPCQSSTRINIRSSILEKGFQKLEKLLICILAKLTTRKKHKLSRHVPLLKQLNFFFSMLAEIMTNNTQYTTTELIYTQHPLVTHWRKLNLPFVDRLNHQYYYPRISTGFATKK